MDEWMPEGISEAERQARLAVRRAVRQYVALNGRFPEEEEGRYRAMERAYRRLHRMWASA